MSERHALLLFATSPLVQVLLRRCHKGRTWRPSRFVNCRTMQLPHFDDSQETRRGASPIGVASSPSWVPRPPRPGSRR